MLKNTFANLGMFGKLLMLVFLFFFFSIIGLGVITVAFGSTDDIQTLKINQLILSVFTLLLPPIVCGYFWYEKPWRAYSLHKFPSGKMIFLSILLIFSISPFINLLVYINEQMVLPDFLASLEKVFIDMEKQAKELTERMLDVNTFGGLIFTLFVMAVMPAVGEELFCRGALQNIFAEKVNKHVAVWIVAIIFSLIHFQMYGFLPRMVLGALLGYLLVWSGSLWLPIIIHFINNATVVLTNYFGKGTATVEAIENIGKAETWGFGIASAVISGMIIWWILRIKSQQAQ